MSEDDIDLIPTQDLVQALYRRTGPAGALLVVILSDQNETEEGKQLCYYGGMMNAIGLASWAHHTLLHAPPFRVESVED